MYAPTMLGDYKFENKFSWLPTKIDERLIWLKPYKSISTWEKTPSGDRDWVVQKKKLIASELNTNTYNIQ